VVEWQLRQEPRRWQSDALQVWRKKGRRGIAGVVTGAGKTVFAELCLLDFLNNTPGGQVAIIVPTLALLDQWFVDIQEDLGVANQRIATFSGEGKAESPEIINLLVLNTARVEAPRLSQVAPTLLIVDECHRAASPQNAKALEGGYASTLGLSATPERDYDQGLSEVLEPLLGEQIYEYGYDEASADGVIAPFVLVNVLIPLLPAEQKRYEAQSFKVGAAIRAIRAGEGDDARLRIALQQRAMVSIKASSRVPVAVWLVDRHRGRRTVVFHEEIASAEQIYKMLQEHGHNVTIYHSKVPEHVRRDNLRLFRRGVFQVLVSCRALDEGMNVPETEIGIVASSSASLRQRIQRLGRVLRPAKGKSSATVFTLYATEVEERRLQEEAERLESALAIRWQRAKVGNAATTN
jgi:superfamily II DNA or RNA helicase